MKNLISKKSVAIVAGLLAAANLASASGTVTYNYTGETGGGIGMGIHTADYNGGALIGEFIMTSSTPGYTTPLLTYCTDIGAELAMSYNYTPTPLASATGVNPVWINGGIQNAARLWYYDHTAATTAIQTAGVQLAIWELLYTTPTTGFLASQFFNTANNNFYLTTTDANTVAAANYAASLINGLNSLPTSIDNVIWLAPTAANGAITGSQGLLLATPATQTPPPAATPDATSTLGLLGAAAVGLLAAQRKLAGAAQS